MAEYSLASSSKRLQLPPDFDYPTICPPRSTDMAPRVTIIGTGDFGRALAGRFLQNGYQVVCGSRFPSRRCLASRDQQLAGVPVVSLNEALTGEAEIILLAIPAKHMVDTLKPYGKHTAGKILVDVSNNDTTRSGGSHAEELAATYNGAMVVKAFNTLSAYALSSGHATGNNQVLIASDSPYAREVVSGMARDLGLQASVFGGLRTARELERMPLKLWRGWGGPVFIMMVTWVAWCIYGTWRYHHKKARPFSRWPVDTNNKIMGCTSITLLAFCYLPGSIAAVAQLCYGTKHRAFPKWLNGWMGMRKQLGLLALWLGGVHAILSLAHISPAYFPKWYSTTSMNVPVNGTQLVSIPIESRMTWIGELAVCLGTLALGTMVFLGITSLPSVGSRLNWRQWTFIQSSMGHICLFLALAHVSLKVLPYIFWRSFFVSVQGMSFLSTVIPFFALLFRLILLLPCFYIPIKKIRAGWERGVNKDDDEEVRVGSPGANLHVYASHAFVPHREKPERSVAGDVASSSEEGDMASSSSEDVQATV